MEHTSSVLVPVTPEQSRKAERIVKDLRFCSNNTSTDNCRRCRYMNYETDCMEALMTEAADLLAELAGIRKDNKNGR